MSDLDLHVARLTAAGVLRVYKVGAVPASPTGAYCVLSLDTGRPTMGRVGGPSGSLIHTLAVQAFGPSHDAVLDMLKYADAAFQGKTLTDLPGTPMATRALGSRPTRDPDAGGVLGAIHVYTY